MDSKLPNGQLPKDAIVIEPGMTLETVERLVILSTLARCNQNRTHAAKTLGICLRTLRNKLRKYRDEEINFEPVEEAS